MELNPYNVPETEPSKSKQDSSMPIERAAGLYVFWMALIPCVLSLIVWIAYLTGSLR